ncbi:MAG: carbohydrate binding domain-containing protein [Chloroflexota bacterium]
MKSIHFRFAASFILLAAVLFWSSAGTLNALAIAQLNDPTPPAEIVKLIFIHHSTGENWLTDGYGDLGVTLGQNNYFVSDTNYGWGPDAIGDRTDIYNWPEWFRGPEGPRYLEALYNESGQNSGYTRTLPDPGGENQIIMFKSCFPNSNLEGNPDDPPAPGDGLTVSNAKYVYNDLLNYFVTRPDKLFVVITAPPVQDPSYAANARAFNNWLMQDWLQENNYPLNNVAVFDFYNVLSDPNNHHRFINGDIEWINSNGRGTSAYPSSGDDDHPSVAGSRKATDEFVPLLNVFYNRWRAGGAAVPPPEETALPIAPPPTAAPGGAGTYTSNLIDDFEGGIPEGSEGWMAYRDEATRSAISCSAESGAAYAGNAAMHIRFAIEANSWGTCALLYNEHHSWESSRGLSLYVHASQPAMVFSVDAYRGPIDSKETYLFEVETTQEMVDGWVKLELPWDMLRRADWEESPGAPYVPNQVVGMAFGFGTFPDAPNEGEIWVDDVSLMGSEAPVVAPTEAPALPPEPTATSQTAVEPTAAAPTEEPASGGGGRLCPGSMALGALALVGVVWGAGRRRRPGVQAL